MVWDIREYNEKVSFWVSLILIFCPLAQIKDFRFLIPPGCLQILFLVLNSFLKYILFPPWQTYLEVQSSL